MNILILSGSRNPQGQKARAVEALRTAGANGVGILALVDRNEGGADNIRAAGLPFVALSNRPDYMG